MAGAQERLHAGARADIERAVDLWPRRVRRTAPPRAADAGDRFGTDRIDVREHEEAVELVQVHARPDRPTVGVDDAEPSEPVDVQIAQAPPRHRPPETEQRREQREALVGLVLEREHRGARSKLGASRVPGCSGHAGDPLARVADRHERLAQ